MEIAIALIVFLTGCLAIAIFAPGMKSNQS